MKNITVSASRTYDICIGSGLLLNAGKYCLPFCPNHRAAIITDDRVAPLYLQTLKDALEKSGITSITHVITHGEASKNGKNFLDTLEFLAENQITRTDTIIALGGGVVGDLAGFVAASYLRGIAFIQIPTTLLAMVDSSVGGKTAIDLQHGKNLAGAFYQPHLVLCDYSTLNTLSRDIFCDGCAEIIKYAVLQSPELFHHLLECGTDFDRERVIGECVLMKQKIVNADEFEKGERKLLNLGHTVGHAIEYCSHFSVSHGKAVAAGMAFIARCAVKAGLCRPDVAEKIVTINQRFFLPCETSYGLEELYSAILADKKRNGDQITFVLPKDIGNCFLHPMNTSEIKAFLSLGL